LADPSAAIVVADQEQEQLARDAVARLRRSVSQTTPANGTAARVHSRVDGPPDVPASPAAAAYGRELGSLPPRAVRLDEPRLYSARAAYQEREARRAALGLGSSHAGLEPDVEPYAHVVGPVAPGSGWSYTDMTRALSVAASSHLISPEPNEPTVRNTRREVADLGNSLAAERRAEQVRQATMAAKMREEERRGSYQVERPHDGTAEREGASF
jgi:hypothetical protein